MPGHAPETRFDHIAIAMERLADAPAVLVGVLGGRADRGGPGRAFRWGTWRYEGGGRLEVIEPVAAAGPDGFLQRYLERHGPGIHHVTFKVPDLRAACDRAEAHGIRVVGYDDADPAWQTAYLHPKEALGIVVQLGHSVGGDTLPPWTPPPSPPNPPPAVRVLGLRLRARSAARARRQWETVLGGVAEPSAGNLLVYRWPRSPLRIAVEIDPAADEGPIGIELAGDRPVAIPEAARQRLGARFLTVAVGQP
jgi:catechol 2,3-dioxygenase-like lactoylglutathione lyase family enzyme